MSGGTGVTSAHSRNSASLHGPHVGGLGKSSILYDRRRWRQCYRGRAFPPHWIWDFFGVVWVSGYFWPNLATFCDHFLAIFGEQFGYKIFLHLATLPEANEKCIIIYQRTLPYAPCRRGCWNSHSDLLFDTTSRISIFNLLLLLDRTFWRAISKYKGVYVRVVCTGRPFMSPVMLYRDPFNWFLVWLLFFLLNDFLSTKIQVFRL